MLTELIRHRAYEISISSNRGTPEEHWIRAEQEVRSVPAVDHTMTLLPYFAWPTGDVSPEVEAALAAVAECQHMLWRPERRITFFGVFKAGKSTVLNALIGHDLLPTRANRATGIVTRLAHGHEVSAWIGRQHNGKPQYEAIALHEMPRYTLLDVSQEESKSDETIQEIRVHLPLPLLERHVVLVDTPGLRDSPAMTVCCHREVAAADLAVMVLDATQVLAEADRHEAVQVNTWLGGNLVFLVNRIDQVRADERDEIVQHVCTGVAEVGNDLVGRGQVFTSAASAVHQAHTNGSNGPASDLGLTAFAQWLQHLVASEAMDRLAALSRLSILKYRLELVCSALEGSLADARQTVSRLRQYETAVAQTKVRELLCKVTEDKLALSRLRGELDQFGDTFVSGVSEQVETIMAQSDWQQHLAMIASQPIAAYVETINRCVKSAVTQTKVPLPTFSLNTSGTEGITAVEDNAVMIGGGIGLLLSVMTFGMDFGLSTIAGTALGAFVSKRLFGRDIKQETKEKLLTAARNAKAALRTEAEKYFQVVEEQLNNVEHSHLQPRPTPDDLRAAEVCEQQLTTLLRWCQGFEAEVKRVLQRVIRQAP